MIFKKRHIQERKEPEVKVLNKITYIQTTKGSELYINGVKIENVSKFRLEKKGFFDEEFIIEPFLHREIKFGQQAEKE